MEIEKKPEFFEHKCDQRLDLIYWKCQQYIHKKGLKLKISIPKCCHFDEYEIDVKFCPFCGYGSVDK